MKFNTVAPALSLVALALVSAPAAADLKIAVVSAQQLFMKPMQEGRTALSSEFSKREGDLQASNEKLAQDAKEFQREAETMSLDQRNKKERDLKTRKLDLDESAQQLQEEEGTRTQQLQVQIHQRVNLALQQVAKDKGFDLVVQDPAYASPVIPDITDDVARKIAATPAVTTPAPAASKK